MRYNVMHYNTIPMLYDAIQYDAMLYYTMLYDAIRYYTMLYDAIQARGRGARGREEGVELGSGLGVRLLRAARGARR